MAAFDHWQWKTQLPILLLSGKGKIVNTGGTNYSITVFWDEDRTGATDTDNCPPTSVDDMRCVQLITRL
jgi:hypothetical protein